jgi:hypothetical protein
MPAGPEGVMKRAFAGWLCSLAGAALLPTAVSAGGLQARIEREKPYPADGLRQIYNEVKEIGPRPGESFINHEFFLGPADDDTYKKEHIVVTIHAVDVGERMSIQITEMKTRTDNPRIQLAGRVRSIVCLVANDELTVVRADYTAHEVEGLAPDILRAVREKKKLLKMLKPGTCARIFFRHNREAAAATAMFF